MGDEHSRPRRRPSRRTLLTGGALLGTGVAGAGVYTLTRDGDVPPAAPTASPTEASPWAMRDERFLKELTDSGEDLTIERTYRDVFPALKIRDVLPLPGLGKTTAPWTAATIIGPTNQLQITATSGSAPGVILSIPEDVPGGIESMAWDEQQLTLYLSAAGRVWAWRYSSPQQIVAVADVPGARTLYELLVDPQGIVWGGTFPTGTIFTFDPRTKAVHTYSRFAQDSEYVRRLTMDASGRLWAGTGSVDPRLFTFLSTSPESRQEIPLPDPLANGFISAIRAGTETIRVTTDGHPDIFELDATTRSWTGRTSAKGWIRTPSSTILRDNSSFMTQDGQLLEVTARSTTPVAQIADDAGATVHRTVTGRLLSVPTADGFTLSTLSAAQPAATAVQQVALSPGVFTVQSLLAAPDGNLYIGGFKGEGITALDPDTDERWSSPDDVNLIHQIENMVSTENGQLYLGTYSWADIIRCDATARDEAKSYSRVDRFSSPYKQSRPFGLALNSRSLFVGTVPNYGISGGILARIDLGKNATDWVLDGDGDGFIAGHSIVGLVADEKYLYGTTSVRNGSGAEDTEGPAQVFQLEITTRRIKWQSAPVADAGALYAPKLVAGWLLVADLEGIAVIDPRDGNLMARHRLSQVANSSQRPGWAAADLAVIGHGEQLAHSAGGSVAVADITSGKVSRLAGDETDPDLGPRITISQKVRMFITARGTDVAHIRV